MGADMKAELLATCGLCAFAFCAPLASAAAQTQSTAPTTAAGDTVTEIIVTAERRTESAQSAPLTINAFSGAELKDLGINTPVDLMNVTPGLSAHGSMGDANPIFTIRGIGLNDIYSNNSSPIGLYVDDVLVPFNPMMSFQMFDLQRVEVLSGPQGTLYGRNTTGGAINLITAEPSQEFGGYGRLDYGGYERLNFEGAVTGALTPNLAGRLSVNGVDQFSGWQHVINEGDRTNGQVRNLALRAQLLWTPNSHFKANLSVSGVYDDSQEQLKQFIGFLTPKTGQICPQVLAGYISGACVDNLGYSYSGNPRDAEGDPVYGNTSQAYGGVTRLTTETQFDRMSLTTVSGLTLFTRKLGDNSTATPEVELDSLFRDKVYSLTQEVRLASDSSWGFDWIVGAYASKDQIKSNILQAEDDSLGTRTDVNFTQITTTGAVFGDAKFPIVKDWSIDIGLRDTYEQKSFVYHDYDLNPFGTSPFGGGLLSSTDDTISTDRLTWKIGLNYQPTPSLLVYASYNRGFKSGGFDGAISFNEQQLEPYRPETIDAYELGEKATLFNRTLVFDSAFYFYNWHDFQAFAVQVRGGIPVDVLTNAGDAQVYGLEGQLTWRPIKNFDGSFGFNWMHSGITSFIAAPDEPDDVGNRLANAPNLSMFARVEYRFDISYKGFKPFIEMDGNFQSKVFYDITNEPVYSQNGYGLLNGKVGARSATGWEVYAYVHNLTNKTYIPETFNGGFSLFPSEYYLGDPITGGIDVRYRF
jgi:iron complex outermembrane receptor protein